MGLKETLKRDLWTDPRYEVNQMACPEITIVAVTKEFYGQLLQMATAAGAEFDGEVAKIEGCEFNWNYDAQAQVLHITCTKKPFIASCAMVADRINALINKARQQGGFSDE